MQFAFRFLLIFPTHCPVLFNHDLRHDFCNTGNISGRSKQQKDPLSSHQFNAIHRVPYSRHDYPHLLWSHDRRNISPIFDRVVRNSSLDNPLYRSVLVSSPDPGCHLSFQHPEDLIIRKPPNPFHSRVVILPSISKITRKISCLSFFFQRTVLQ